MEEHLEEQHAEELEPIRERQLRGDGPNALLSIYNQAVSCKCRQQAPIAGPSLDRTALRSYTNAMAKDRVQALACFSCGGLHPYVEEVADKGEIQWHRPLQRAGPDDGLTFLGQPLDKIKELLGLQAYLAKYNVVSEANAEGAPDIRLTDHESFEDWTVKLPGLADSALLCCPEDRPRQSKLLPFRQDRCCDVCREHGSGSALCEHCQLPICKECAGYLAAGRLPPPSYANDMWTGYGLQRIYEQKVTAIELVCASPYLTSMVLLSMESRKKRQAEDPGIFDEKAHMARHRFGARGNAITFPMPVEEMLQALQGKLPEEDAAVPRSGAQLGQAFRVILKTNKHGCATEEEIKSLVHQAVVRREAGASHVGVSFRVSAFLSAAVARQQVVVNLILDMKEKGHPSFVHLEEDKVRERAEALPEHGVPEEVLNIIPELVAEDAPRDDKLQPQKQAAPREAPLEDPAAAGAAFAAQRPRVVAAEGRRACDAQEAAKGALEGLAAELAGPTQAGMQTLEVRAGNQLLDQFQPAYWSMAFCFLFPYGTAQPDVHNRVSPDDARKPSRRQAADPGAPSVGIQDWAANMQRSIASQFRRDWNFAPALWNYLFRTLVNLQPNAYMYTAVDLETGSRRLLTNQELEKGVREVYQQLDKGIYVDVSGAHKAVKGDLTKVKHVPNLSEAAKKLLMNCEARTKKIPGTHDVRSTMRHQTHAYRVNYGLAQFVTFSPSERDTTIMLRMVRARKKDPAIQNDPAKAFYGRDKPELDVDYLRLSPERLAEARGFRLRSPVDPARQALPNYDDRRALLARDPLACWHGFVTLVGLVFRHILGVRFCPNCPDCCLTDSPCADAFGSNATAFGGVFGRVDAFYGSLENQKAGPYHIHGQLYVQCVSQFTSLQDLMAMGSERVLEHIRRFSDYSAHCSRKVYCDVDAWRKKQEEVENGWPEYRDSHLMLTRPDYQSDRALEADAWKLEYLAKDVESLQQHKQHHVHIPDAHGVRQPLEHCRDPKDPTKCKAGFPRDDWLTDELLLICPGLAEDRHMPYTGKRNMTGLLWGPCNDGSLNGNHPAMLAALRCNGDVQLPYRFPITPDTHSAQCPYDCDQKMPVWQLVQAAETAQRAQVGYACDYQNKRLPIAVYECKEWMRAQRALYEDLKENKAGYFAARAAKRLITDCYGRGVVRGAVEIANLVLNSGHPDPTKAESIKTADVTPITLRYPLQLLLAVRAGKPWPAEPRRTQVDKRSYTCRALQDCPPWTLYGGRGANAQVHMLSAYEFWRHYYLKQARHPYTGNLQKHHRDPDQYHAELTEEGLAKGPARQPRPCGRSGLQDQGRGWLVLGAAGGWPVRKSLPARLGGGQEEAAFRARGARRRGKQDQRGAGHAHPGALLPLGQRRAGSHSAGPLRGRPLAAPHDGLVPGAAGARRPRRLPDAGGEDLGPELRLRLLPAQRAPAGGRARGELRQRRPGRRAAGPRAGRRRAPGGHGHPRARRRR